MPSTESYQLLLAAAAACEDKKAEDIRILALDPSESGLTDYFLICNGTNDRQNVAITDEIEIRLKREFGTYPNSVEGRRQGEWVLMDYVDFIVHVFSPEKRAFYGLERLRKSATVLSIADLNAEIKAAITATRKKPAAPAVPTAKAPPPGTKKLAAPKKTAAGKPTPAPKKKTAVKKPTSPAKKPVASKKSPSKSIASKSVAAKKSAAKSKIPKASKSAATKKGSAKKRPTKKS
jgi:ribosome-associated protein